jgi:hypothetical protein
LEHLKLFDGTSKQVQENVTALVLGLAKQEQGAILILWKAENPFKAKQQKERNKEGRTIWARRTARQEETVSEI